MNVVNLVANIFSNKNFLNILWLITDKLVKLILGLIVTIYLARYLSPSSFGSYNYIVSIVSMCGVFCSLGLGPVVVRELIGGRERSKVLSSALLLTLLAALIVYGLLLWVLRYFGFEDDKFLLVATLGMTLIFRVGFVFKYWFEAKVNSKYVVYVESLIFISTSMLTLFLIYKEAALMSFIMVLVVDSIFVSLGLFFIFYCTEGSWLKLDFNLAEIKYLCSQSWPLLVSGVAWVCYTKIDQIMIEQMLGNSALGIYASASRLSEVMAFLPAAIVSSIAPSILKYRKSNARVYNKIFQNIYDVNVTLTVATALFVTAYSEQIIDLLYGLEYKAASSVLMIQFWTFVFAALAIVSGRYYINEGMQRITMKRHLLGLGVNIVLNYFMIPVYGIDGAALASLISMVFANYFYDFSGESTKLVFYQKTNALFFMWLCKILADKVRGKNI